MDTKRPDERSAGSVRLDSTDTSPVHDVPLETLCEAIFNRLEGVENSQILGRLLGQLRTRLSLLTNCGPNRYSTIKSRQLLSFVRKHPDFRDELVAGRTLVELGCGGLNPHAGHLAFAALGATRCVGVDLESPKNPELAARSMFEVAAEMMLVPGLYFSPTAPDPELLRTNLADVNFQRLRDGHLDGLPADRFQIIEASAGDTGLDTNSADICVSVSFLEHVDDVDQVLAEMARLTPSGRLGVHLIDGADHRSYWKPEYDRLQFLTEEPGGGHYTGCNRMRPRQFLERFDAHGFDVVKFEPMLTREVTAELRAKLVPPFTELSDDDLSVIDGIAYVVRR